MADDQIVRVGDILEMKIEDLVFGGEGIAKIQSGDQRLVVFVEDVVPEDKVMVRITRKKRNYVNGVVVKMVQESPLRIKGRCLHFGSAVVDGVRQTDFVKGCGGCVWQFLSYEKQLELKERQVKDAMERIGKMNPKMVLPILGCDPWYYRNKMEFSFGIDANGGLSLGLHLRHRHHDVVELTECFLLEPYVGALVTFVRDYFREISDRFDMAKGEDMKLLSFTIRQAKNTGKMMCILSAENGEENFVKDFADALKRFCVEKEIRCDSFYFLHTINKKGQRKVIHERLVFGAKTIQESMRLPQGDELKFKISPQAFFQPNTKQAQLLYSKALEAATLTGKEVVFDLFCGTGTIGLFCAKKAKKVFGIELIASAIENAKQNARLNGIENAEFFVGDVKDLIEKLSVRPDVVVVDPPRNGLIPKVVEQIMALNPKLLVYVSCNPTSLARDAQLFVQGGYRLNYVQPVDMFAQTYHIENVAQFERNE